MSQNSEQLNLDVGSIFVPKAVASMLAGASMSRDFSEESSKLDFVIRLLEEEMRKIDAFKRELPHCMHLLKDAIEALKKEKMQLKGRRKWAVMEELMPQQSEAEGGGRAKPSNDINEKNNGMGELWSIPLQFENNFDTQKQNPILPSHEKEEEEKGSKRKGAFVPYKKSSIVKAEEKKEGAGVPIDLNVTDTSDSNGTQLPQPGQARKLRRCWSPELHKRFVDALLLLGGPHTATPKQIRELMNVDGLTNDEVKSHLQKYRLHIRKLPSRCAAYPWRLNKERGEASKRACAQSESAEAHLHEGGSASGRGGSATAGDSMEEEVEMENQTWNGRF